MTPFKFFRRHWHDVGLISAAVAGIYLAVAWHDLGFLQRILILNFIVVLLHQFEEYSWPGGFPAVANLVFMPLEPMSRYFKPLNQLSSAVANVAFAYVFYLLPVFFPGTIWLGLSTMIVGAVLQVIGHAIVVNYQIRSLYSPGVATAVFGWLPLGAVYVYYIQEHGLAGGWEWLAAIGYTIVAMTLIFYVIEQRILDGENPPYPFDPDEIRRFDIQGKLERARRRGESNILTWSIGNTFLASTGTAGTLGKTLISKMSARAKLSGCSSTSRCWWFPTSSTAGPKRVSMRSGAPTMEGCCTLLSLFGPTERRFG